MDVIVVCHTEFGFVHDRQIIFDKNAVSSVEKGVKNLIKIADQFSAKITFVVCPEVVNHFPKDVEHEIGLHIHPGWEEYEYKGFKWHVGDAYLRQHCKQSLTSTVLRDYPYEEQLEMIESGKEYIEKNLGIKPKTFVAGRWSENCDTHKALINVGITHDCSSSPSNKAEHFDWSELPRICMPYHPSDMDYQKEGDLPLLIVPISQYFPRGNVGLEAVNTVGLSWLKACFMEYYTSDLPLFHICLHSPCTTDPFFISALGDLLKFISNHKKVTFKFASMVKEPNKMIYRGNILLYFSGVNSHIIKSTLKSKDVES